MISVGDSTDVSIFEVIDGGREFRQIATYTGQSEINMTIEYTLADGGSSCDRFRILKRME